MGSQGHFQYERVIEYMYRFNFGFNSRKGFEEKLEIFFEHIRAKYHGEPTEGSFRDPHGEQTDERL
jgi:hypothetical protein